MKRPAVRLLVAGTAATGVLAAAGPAAARDDLAPYAAVPGGPQAHIVTSGRLPLHGAVTVGFDRPVLGASAASVQLVATTTGRPVPAVLVGESDRRVVLKPRQALVAGEPYRVVVGRGVRDVLGRHAVGGSSAVQAAATIPAGDSALTQTWDPDVDPRASGGGYVKSAAAGDTATLSFSGTSVTVTGVKSRGGGYARVALDGEYQGTVDFYAPSTEWNARIWAPSAPLGAGAHTLQFTVTGTHREASVDSLVYLDTFTTGATTYEETSSRVRYAWSRQVATDATSGHFDAGYQPALFDTGGQAQVSAVVSGTSLTVLLCKGPTSGYASLVIDGEQFRVVDLYQSWSQCGVKAFATSMTGGQHTVTVRATGARNNRSTGTRVGFDAFVVGD